MIKVRPARPTFDEDAFVAMNWRQSFERESRIRMELGLGAYQRFMRQHIERLRTEEGAFTLIATPEDDDDHFLGFAVFREPELHYVYVKFEMRKAGVARALLAERNITTCTALTRKGRERLRPEERGWAVVPRQTL